MEFFTFNTETELDKLQTQIKETQLPLEDGSGIIVDVNHKLSEDARMGNKLAQSRKEWYEYFGM
jgi:hypothetical protein